MTCLGQPQPKGRQLAHDGPVWEDDAIEVFVQPPGMDGYYHLAANAAGAQYDARIAGSYDTSWSPAWTVKTGRIADGWTAEMTLPLASLGATLGGVWRMNFCREEADTQRATSWAYLFGGFHSPERFGEVAFR